MSRTRFYKFFFTLIPVLFFLWKPAEVGDLSIWIALGRDTLNSFSVRVHDTYTVVSTTDQVYPVMLSVLYGLLYKLGSIGLVLLVHAFVPSVWVLIWISFLRRSLGSQGEDGRGFEMWTPWSLGIFTTALTGCGPIFLARPSLVATLPLLISYVILVRDGKKPMTMRTVLPLVAIEIIWVNIHGSFLILPLMLAWQSFGFICEGRFKMAVDRARAVILILLASLANPFGWKSFWYVIETARTSRARGLDEWLPAHRMNYAFASLSFFLLFCCLAALIAYETKKRGRRWLITVLSDPFVPICCSGFLAVRNTVLPFLLLPVFIFQRFPNLITTAFPTQTSRFSRRINASVIIAMAIGIVVLSPFVRDRDQQNSKSHAPNAMRYLRDHTGLVFNDWIYGSDLALEQKNRYFIDTRNVIFSDRDVAMLDRFMSHPSSGFAALQPYGFRYFLIDEKSQTALAWMESSGDFILRAKDSNARLYELKTP